MHPDLKRIILSQEEIAQCVSRLAREITDDYRGREPLFVGVLNGAVFITADLVRRIDLPCQIDFVGTSSYRDNAVSGELVMTKEPSISPEGRDVILVEDVLDSGKTLRHLRDHYLALGASSVRICVMLDKTEAHQTEIQADYIGAPIGNDFIVGYGLDYAQKYRNLPYIGILKPEIYT